MKVLNIASVSKTFEFFRGGALYFRKKGFQVGLASDPGDTLTDLAQKEGAEAFPIPIKREISPLQDLISLFRLIGLIRKYRPDVVHASNPKGGLLGMLSSWFCRVPLRIYQVRGLRLETTKGIKYLILLWMERLACRCATRVICNSFSVREVMVQKRLVSSTKAIVLGQGSARGVNSLRFSLNQGTLSSALSFRKQHGINQKSFVLGFSGRLLKDKGINELVQAFNALQQDGDIDYRLVILGGDESGEPVDPETMNQIRNNERIITTGHISDVENYLSLLDLFVFPSYREGFPNAVLEAASMGLPTVGFSTTGVRDAVIDGQTGNLVPFNHVELLTEAIRKLAHQHDLRLKYSLAARKRCVTDYQPQFVWQNFVNEYIKLMEKRKMTVPVEEEKEPLGPPLDPIQDEIDFRCWSSLKKMLLNGLTLNEVAEIFHLSQGERNNVEKLFQTFV